MLMPESTTARTCMNFNGVPSNASEKKYSAGKQNNMVERNRIGTLTAAETACKGSLASPTMKP